MMDNPKIPRSNHAEYLRQWRKERMKDPNYREQMREYARKSYLRRKENPEYTAPKMDPEKRKEYMRAYKKRREEDPEYRKKHNDYQRNYQRKRNEDPEYRKKRNEYMRNYMKTRPKAVKSKKSSLADEDESIHGWEKAFDTDTGHQEDIPHRDYE